jgi:RNA polymerase sigma-70 factor (ECF subfamily)
LGWLHAILVNVVRDLWGRRQPPVSLNSALDESSACMERWIADPAPTPDQEAERHELLAAVAQALDALPEDQREVIVRHHMMGESTREVAAQVGRTADSVKMLLYRGLKEVRCRLRDEGMSWP